ncbi:MAG: TonB family protein [Archangiaceae bacterium]|nr:TonB family protein [Archangiaceae bacterium]
MNGLALRFCWGEHRLHTEVLKPGSRAFTVGSAHGVDFPSGDVSGCERFTLVPAGDLSTVRFMRGMRGAVWRADAEQSLHDAISSGDAVPDGDGYALTLSPRDAVRLELGGLAVEAVPVPVPAAVAAHPLDALDGRMLNILAVVGVLASACIVAAVTHESDSFEGDELPPQTRVLARYVAVPAPQPRAQAPAMSRPDQPKQAAGAGAAAPNREKTTERAPASHGRDPKAFAQQLAQAVSSAFGHEVFKSSDPLGVAMGAMRRATLASNGLGGLTLKGDGRGGGGDETVRIGGIDRPGRGRGPGSAPDGAGILCKAGTECKQKPPPETVGSSEVTVVGMDKEIIRQVIHRNRSQVRYCYELQLTRNPTLQGKTSVRFVITGTGTVSASHVVESTVRSRDLEDCVAGRVRTWHFPAPPGGGSVTVTYPFVFRTGGEK